VLLAVVAAIFVVACVKCRAQPLKDASDDAEHAVVEVAGADGGTAVDAERAPPPKGDDCAPGADGNGEAADGAGAAAAAVPVDAHPLDDASI
jgi:hypothetical protein